MTSHGKKALIMTSRTAVEVNDYQIRNRVLYNVSFTLSHTGHTLCNKVDSVYSYSVPYLLYCKNQIGES